MEDVSIIHISASTISCSRTTSGTRSSGLAHSTRTIGSSRSVALGIVTAFLLLRGLAEKMWKNAMIAVTIFPKHFVSHYTTLWSSTSTVGWYAGTRAQERWCTAQTLTTLIPPSQSCTPYHEEKPCFWRPCTYRLQHLPLHWRRPERNAEWKLLDWFWISFNRAVLALQGVSFFFGDQCQTSARPDIESRNLKC